MSARFLACPPRVCPYLHGGHLCRHKIKWKSDKACTYNVISHKINNIWCPHTATKCMQQSSKPIKLHYCVVCNTLKSRALLLQMPPKVIWGSPMTKMCIYLGVKNGHLGGCVNVHIWGIKNANLGGKKWQNLQNYFLGGAPNVPKSHDWNVHIWGIKNAHFGGQKCQIWKKSKFLLQMMPGHVGVSNNQNLHTLPHPRNIVPDEILLWLLVI